MEICQYEFQFQNEYMGIIENKLSTLLNISLDETNTVRKEKDKENFIFRKGSTNNFTLFVANKASYVYLLIVRCEKRYEVDLRKILLDICDEIEDDYDEDHRKEVKDVYLSLDSWFCRIEKECQISSMLGI